MAFIRPYEPRDAERAKYICRVTLPPSLSSSEPAGRICGYLWTLQFTHLAPENCFVLDDGSGTTVGYVIGCPDVYAFAAAYPRYVEDVLRSPQGRRDVPEPEQLETREPWLVPDPAHPGQETVNEKSLAQLAYSPEWLILSSSPEKAALNQAYRAMMHIDMVPEFQGQGWGRKMIERFVESIRASLAADPSLDAGKGINIGVSGENTKVVPFYEKVGFKVYPGGEKESGVWMVRDL